MRTDTLSNYAKTSFTANETKQISNITNIEKAMEENFKSKYKTFIDKVNNKTKESEGQLREFIEVPLYVFK